jgi:hypothetical protein
MNILIVGIVAFAGAMATALLAWSNSDPPEKFNFRKFLGSIIRGIIAAVGVAAAFNYASIESPIMYLFAFLSGAGVDAAGVQAQYRTKTLLGR